MLSAEHPPVITMDVDLEVQGLCVWCGLSLQQLLQSKDSSAALYMSVCETLPWFYRAEAGLTLAMWCGFEVHMQVSPSTLVLFLGLPFHSCCPFRVGLQEMVEWEPCWERMGHGHHVDLQ